MDTMVLVIGGHTQVLIERVIEGYPVEDWDYFISGFNDHYNDSEEYDREWFKFINDNGLMGRIMEGILRKFDDKIRKYIDRRVMDLVSDGYNKNQIIFDITILPDPLTDLYLLTVKSNIIADTTLDVEFMLLN